MRTFLWVVLLFDQLFMILIGAVNLKYYEVTDFQLKQLLEDLPEGSRKVRRDLHKKLPQVKRLQHLELVMAFAVSIGLLTYLVLPSALGVLYGLLLALAVCVVSRIGFIQDRAHGLFESTLEVVLATATKLAPLWWLIGTPVKSQILVPQSVSELSDAVSHMNATALSTEQKERLQLVLELPDKKAKDIMTSARKVTHVAPSSTLGPIVLADLEKSGHGYFPVVSKKDGVVGMLSLKQVSDISSAKHHAKVGDIMSEEVVWVPDDMSILEVAHMFLQAKQYMLLVENEDLEFAGIITIADLLKNTLTVT